ncbi:MAG TPA: hypothetical protein VGS80_02170 [Ktedonobacterales bacterium]|nr:hypothetical protein [Ktedonobacterales bacterium]
MALRLPVHGGECIGELAEMPMVRSLTGRRAPRLLRLVARDAGHEGIVVEQHIREGRFQRSLALIAAFSALLGGLDVTYEHYRGSYSQRVMYGPVLISPLVVLRGVWGAFNRRVARSLLPLAAAALLADGVLGFVFHVRGVARKPGGWRIPVFNVVMGPPLFAPLLLGISGLLGVIASVLRREDDPARTKLTGLPLQRLARVGFLPRKVARRGIVLERQVREGRFQKWLAAATAISALLNGLESLYAHYKNNFTYKSQWLPILLSPLIAIAGIGTVWSKRMARTWLPITSLLATLNGAVGLFYHGRGVLRRSGGVKKLGYNVVYGPPIFAPLLYAATGFVGMLASLLRRAE